MAKLIRRADCALQDCPVVTAPSRAAPQLFRWLVELGTGIQAPGYPSALWFKHGSVATSPSHLARAGGEGAVSHGGNGQRSGGSRGQPSRAGQGEQGQGHSESRARPQHHLQNLFVNPILNQKEPSQGAECARDGRTALPTCFKRHHKLVFKSVV